MSNLNKCPKCGREADKSYSSNWYPVHTCRDCGEKYCDKCGDGSGKKCPKCGSTNYSDYDKVYSK
jgi:predicted nucleic-acid-binding Zn-ribbon protein